MYRSLSAPSPSEGREDSAQSFTVVSKDTMNICVRVFAWTQTFTSVGDVRRAMVSNHLFSFSCLVLAGPECAL